MKGYAEPHKEHYRDELNEVVAAFLDRPTSSTAQRIKELMATYQYYWIVAQDQKNKEDQ